jgi:hypothetical protein
MKKQVSIVAGVIALCVAGAQAGIMLIDYDDANNGNGVHDSNIANGNFIASVDSGNGANFSEMPNWVELNGGNDDAFRRDYNYSLGLPSDGTVNYAARFDRATASVFVNETGYTMQSGDSFNGSLYLRSNGNYTGSMILNLFYTDDDTISGAATSIYTDSYALAQTVGWSTGLHTYSTGAIDAGAVGKKLFYSFTSDNFTATTYAFTDNHSLEVISGPASSGVDLRAYQAADGVYVEFAAYDVEADGTIMLALVGESGETLWSGSVEVSAGPQSMARFLVPGLETGQSYNFRVRDEVGKWWEVNGVTVGSFNSKMTSATLVGLTITFDSLPDRSYDVQWVAALGDEWQTVAAVTATDAQTSVVVEYPDGGEATGFYRVEIQ